MKSKIIQVHRDFDGQIVIELANGKDVYLPIYDSSRILELKELVGVTYNDQSSEIIKSERQTKL